MDNLLPPHEIIDRMLAKDAFSQWLGIECLSIGPGYCTLKMTVRREMVNGFGVAHGGISFSFADSAFAFASNSRGRHAVSVDTSINHLAPVMVGDVLTAKAVELHLGGRLAHYEVVICRADGTKVALFKGMVYRKNDLWE